MTRLRSRPGGSPGDGTPSGSDRPAGAALRRARWRRLRRSAPLLLLLASLGVAAVGAVQAHRVQRSHRDTAEALIRDYGAFAAWSYRQRAAEYLAGGLRAPLALAPAMLLDGAGSEECLEQVLARARAVTECSCGDPLGGSFAFLVLPGREALFVGESPPEAARSGLVAALLRHARATYAVEWDFAVVHVPVAGSERSVVYRRITGPEGDTLLLGYELDEGRVAAQLERAFRQADLLPPSLARDVPNPDLLRVTVRTTGGRALYASREAAEPELYAEQALPAMLAGSVVRASILPEAADGLIIGGLPRSQVPWLLLIFALSALLVILAVSSLRRENQLARQRSDFVASVSHELRTPLAQIRLFVETLRLGRTRSEEQRDWALGNIDRETLRLAGLVENVLHFSRTERGIRMLDRQPVDLRSAVEGVVGTFTPLLPPGQATVECRVPAGLQVELDRNAFRQVLLNLLDNAVKYGPKGQTVRVSATTFRGVVRLLVDDEGPGIPPAERRRIWEPFQRGKRAVGSVVVGSGIGLSVVRELVTSHGGRVAVEDAPGGGARLVLELPALHTVRPERLEGARAAASASGSAGAA